MAHIPRRPRYSAAERPSIVVRHAPEAASGASLRAVCAGIEEEGVPYLLIPAAEGSYENVVDLAHQAAHDAPLDVGMGVDGDGTVCVHHRKLPPETPALLAPAADARAMGHNGARLVTGVAFKPTTPTTPTTRPPHSPGSD